jgi:hypothetical protein
MALLSSTLVQADGGYTVILSWTKRLCASCRMMKRDALHRNGEDHQNQRIPAGIVSAVPLIAVLKVKHARNQHAEDGAR